MACFYHPDRPSTVVCNTCGKSLCTECGSVFQPPTCIACAEDEAKSVKGEMIKNIVISIVLGVVGFFLTGNFAGILLAGIPYGWSILNKITPSMFLWLSWVGWLVYFFIKLILAAMIGMVALPIKLFQWISELKRVKKLQEAINRKTGQA